MLAETFAPTGTKVHQVCFHLDRHGVVAHTYLLLDRAWARAALGSPRVAGGRRPQVAVGARVPGAVALQMTVASPFFTAVDAAGCPVNNNGLVLTLRPARGSTVPDWLEVGWVGLVENQTHRGTSHLTADETPLAVPPGAGTVAQDLLPLYAAVPGTAWAELTPADSVAPDPTVPLCMASTEARDLRARSPQQGVLEPALLAAHEAAG